MGFTVDDNVARTDGFGQFGLHFFAGLALQNRLGGVQAGVQFIGFLLGFTVDDNVARTDGFGQFSFHLLTGFGCRCVRSHGVSSSQGGNSEGDGGEIRAVHDQVSLKV